jgi:hypothetical protein
MREETNLEVHVEGLLPETWGEEVHRDRITCSMLQRIEQALGYDR